MSSPSLRMDVPWSAYPERPQLHLGWLDRQGERLAGVVVRPWRRRSCRLDRFVRSVEAYGHDLTVLGPQDILRMSRDLHTQLRQHGFRSDLVAQTFALVRQVAEKTVGLRHYPVQLIGGRVLLGGMVAEMETGEGKTLAATLPACVAALAGLPVHIITVNDYLASRDAQWMGPIYRSLGLSVGVIRQGMSPHARRAAYACDVTYCTNKELAFDYLKDRIVLGRRPDRIHLQVERVGGDNARVKQLLLRGLCFGIVDEADSVLIDEARTPLIISGPARAGPEQRVYQEALGLADQLEADVEYIVEAAERRIRLTVGGVARLAELAKPLKGVWGGRQRREELVRQALSAKLFFHRDKQYMVREGKVQIVDEFTGRVMPDRSWELGLHQMIEAKEGCQVGFRQEPLARITYQRFFRRYLWLAGMTGTARETAGELWRVYRLPVFSVPTNRRIRRHRDRVRVYATHAEKWDAVVNRVVEVHREGRPVLVGTVSVAASEHLSGLLTAAGLPHRVLNARQDREEATIIAQAGQAGQITVATNMAGRGTDIVLGPEVASRGGLQVIATERHEARRIDRQLFGRCGRQGDPGHYQAFLSLDDELVNVHFPRWTAWLRRWYETRGRSVPRWVGQSLFRLAQRVAERRHAQMRADLLKIDENLESALGFSGHLE